MTDNDFNKQLATIQGEPYITILNSEYDPSQDINGFEFEFDWNPIWIELLVKNGYVGLTEEQIVQQWFEDLCRGVIEESMASDSIPFNSGRVINRNPRGDGKTDYS